MSRSEEKAQANSWIAYKPPIIVEVEHRRSKAKVQLKIDSRKGNQVEGVWPQGLVGACVFDLRTGFGTKVKADVRDWRLTVDGARLLTRKDNYELKNPTVRKQREKVEQEENASDKQLNMWSKAGSPVIAPIKAEPEQTSIFEMLDAIDARQFRAKANKQLKSYTPKPVENDDE